MKMGLARFQNLILLWRAKAVVLWYRVTYANRREIQSRRRRGKYSLHTAR
jgi:hypothetical protein